MNYNELVAGALAGDRDALSRLYQSCWPLVHAVVRKRLPRHLRRDEVIEDTAAEVMLRVVRYLDRFDLRRLAFKPWLYQITRNHCANVADLKANGASALPLESLTADHGPAEGRKGGHDGEPGQVRHVREKEVARALTIALKKLSAKHRRVIGLLVHDNLRQGDIARRLGITPASAKHLLRQARDRFVRAYLDAGGDLPDRVSARPARTRDSAGKAARRRQAGDRP